MKPRICLVCDIPNWAFDIIAKKVKNELQEKFEIRIAYFDMRETPDEFFNFIENNDDCDLIHFFWRKTLILMESETFKNKVNTLGKNVDEYINEKRKKISTGCYDFLFLDEEGINTYKNIFNKYAGNYYVSSKRLYDAYLKIDAIKKPRAVVHDVCNTEKLLPINLERFDDFEREMVIGWVGNSATKINDVDLKGFHTIIKPIIEELKDEGYKIKEHYADRNIKWRTADEMPQYYSEIDLCICASIHEGTPMPIIESMACGVPVITTDVGIVREALGKMQKEYIIGDRENGKNDKEIARNLKNKIIKMYNDRKILKLLSEENQKSIIEYDGGKIIKEFEDYFKECLK